MVPTMIPQAMATDKQPLTIPVVAASEPKDGLAKARARFLAGWCEPLTPGGDEYDGIRYFNEASLATILSGEATTETAPHYEVTAHGCTCEGWQKGRSCYHVKGFMAVIHGPEAARRAQAWKDAQVSERMPRRLSAAEIATAVRKDFDRKGRRR